MFGYVRPQKFEMLVREYDEYLGIYCSLCKELGRRYGLTARLALNYDCTFYALFLLATQKDGCPSFTNGRCCVNPLKKCYYCKTEKDEKDEKTFAAACALTVILTYYKLLDNINDSRTIKKTAYYSIYPILWLKHKKAAKNYPEIEGIVSESMRAQSEIEKKDKPGIDLCAQPTAEMLKGILRLSAEKKGAEPAASRLFCHLGYYLGRWIYIIDAADDLEKDIESGAFNPFIIKFGLNKSSAEEDILAAKKYANGTLNMSLSRIGEAVDLLGFNSLGAITRNILLKGLPQMQKELLFKKEKTNVGPV